MPQAGTATVTYRVASAVDGGVIVIEQGGGGTTYGTINVPNTGNWQSWVNISHEVQLPAGNQEIGLIAQTGGWNLNAITIEVETTCMPNCQTDTVVQAEDFYQSGGVQTQTTQDVGGGLNVGWIDSGDWMNYNVSIPTSSTGLYDITYRIASGSNGGSLKLEQPGGAVAYGNISFGGTGDWQQWTTATHRVSLPAGTNQLAIASTSGSWNINWFEIKAVN